MLMFKVSFSRCSLQLFLCSSCHHLPSFAHYTEGDKQPNKGGEGLLGWRGPVLPFWLEDSDITNGRDCGTEEHGTVSMMGLGACLPDVSATHTL